MFVARATAHAEDDGHLLTIWWNRESERSELLIHDAADLRREPFARVKPPRPDPVRFHGNWADRAAPDGTVAAHDLTEYRHAQSSPVNPA